MTIFFSSDRLTDYYVFYSVVMFIIKASLPYFVIYLISILGGFYA